jgi:cytochrome c oxidase subunit 4
MAHPPKLHASAASHGVVAHHGASLRTYFTVFISLLVLMFLTVAARWVDFGPALNIVIALVIAIAKTALIVLFFMHVWYNSRLTQIFAAATFLWLIILFAFTIGDYLARDWPPRPEEKPLSAVPQVQVAARAPGHYLPGQ